MPLVDARARKIAEYAKVNRDRPDFEDAVRAMAVAELRAAVREETVRCTALIRTAMSGVADVPKDHRGDESQRNRRSSP
jgi:hypothetical protein